VGGAEIPAAAALSCGELWVGRCPGAMVLPVPQRVVVGLRRPFHRAVASCR